MANKHRHDSESFEPLHDGDFRRIAGIGPGIEQRLKAAQITTFDQLASLEVEDILTALRGLVGITAERISSQNWIEQAHLLGETLQRKQGQIHELADDTIDRQHYESFMVELLLDEERSVRRTRVVHIKNGLKDNWAGWNPGKLSHWIAEEAELSNENLTAGQDQADEKLPLEMVGHEAAPAEQPRLELAGRISIGEVELSRIETEQPSRFFSSSEPFRMRVPLDLSQTNVPPGTPLSSRISINTRELGRSKWQPLVDLDEDFLAEDQLAFTLIVEGMPMGTYRLEVTALVSLTNTRERTPTSLDTRVDAGLIQVFADERELVR